MDVIELIGNCPAEIQPDSMQLQKCFDSIKDVSRIVLKDPDGVDPFNDAAVTIAGTQAALKLNFEDKAIWDAAIALIDIDKITLTPGIQDAQRPKTLIEPVELADSTRILPGTLPDQPAIYTAFGISSANHVLLLAMAGLQRDFLLIDKSGQVIYKNLEDAEITNGDSPWFDAKLFNVSTREVLTGSGNVDNMDMQIFSPFGDLDRYAIGATGAFGLIL
jgi:hypothetical protein